MTIKIDDTKHIEKISQLFNRYFPFLKLSFYTKSHDNQEESLANQQITQNKRISEIRKSHFSGNIQLHYWQKTGSVEQEFKDRFGLFVQIFRRHGSSWIQTVGTDDLTLEEQNEIGMIKTEDLLHGTNRKFEQEKYL